VLDQITLEQLMEILQRETNSNQSMYYI